MEQSARARLQHIDHTLEKIYFMDQCRISSINSLLEQKSADLTPMDYFCWGVVKSDVYRVSATTREDMVERIQQSFQRISPLVLSNVRRPFRRRTELCLTENGHHFEQLL
ncbi:hypothetical protein NQ315_002578 [Exocentrus adspersus]|uniref:Uncharacterized protein n=1 Tax=Exocentrus adspersus TaxID=1586481 RepID=A0AAV8VVG3_9CUCU|nr:hypothetical protein NQ315_002578 [Exocentrus adspersus]